MTELVFALDVNNRNTALALASQLRPELEWIKIGLELFTAVGPQLIEPLKAMGYRVFLDLKLHDIPNTVAHAVTAAAAWQVDMLTVHCQGGRRMCEAAAGAASACAHGPRIAGVTVLTSMGESDLPPGCRSVDLVGRMAREAALWGLGGVVCSPWEAGIAKGEAPGLFTVCPGIRLTESPADDQRRTMTPAEAAANGADFIVVGRPIRTAPNPLAQAARIRAMLAQDG